MGCWFVKSFYSFNYIILPYGLCPMWFVGEYGKCSVVLFDFTLLWMAII